MALAQVIYSHHSYSLSKRIIHKVENITSMESSYTNYYETESCVQGGDTSDESKFGPIA